MEVLVFDLEKGSMTVQGLMNNKFLHWLNRFLPEEAILSRRTPLPMEYGLSCTVKLVWTTHIATFSG